MPWPIVPWRKGLSVRKLEEIAAPRGEDLAGQEQSTAVSAHTRTLTQVSTRGELEQELSRKLGTRLRIFPSKKKKPARFSTSIFRWMN